MQWTPRLAFIALLCLTTGFVRAPFPHWVIGEVTDIQCNQHTLIIQEANCKKPPLVLRWDKETRFWIAPTRPNDRGVLFDPKEVAVGASVRIMFKKYSEHNLATRVIRLAPSPHAS